MCEQDSIIKIRSLIGPRYLIDTPYKDIRLAIKNYISPKEKIITAEKGEISWKTKRAKFIGRRSTDGPQKTQTSLSTRRRDLEDSISKNHKMGNSSNGLRLLVEVHTRRTDTP